MNATQEKPVSEILNVSEASEFLRLTRSTIYAYVARRELPYLKVGSRVLFDRDELQSWLDAHRVPALEKPPARDGGD